MVTLIEKFLAELYQLVQQILAKNMLGQKEAIRNIFECSLRTTPQTKLPPTLALILIQEPYQRQLVQKLERVLQKMLPARFFSKKCPRLDLNRTERSIRLKRSPAFGRPCCTALLDSQLL